MNHFATATAAAVLLLGAPAAFAQATSSDPAAQVQSATPAQAQPGQTAGPAGQAYLDQSEVEKRLEDRDFDNIDIKLEGQNYTGKADWYGEEVDLTVSASTGRVIEPTTLTADQVSAKLEDDGYENVSEVREAGDEFTAKAERFGEDMDLRVDASSGNIVDPRELKTDQVATRLDDEGYSNVVIFERDNDYGNYYAKADKDDEAFLLEVNPLSGRIMNEYEEN